MTSIWPHNNPIFIDGLDSSFHLSALPLAQAGRNDSDDLPTAFKEVINLQGDKKL